MCSDEARSSSGGWYILHICRGHWAAQVLFTAVDLGLFDILARGAQTPARVAAALGTHPEATARLLVALEGLGLVEREGEFYRNAPLAGRHRGSAADLFAGGGAAGAARKPAGAGVSETG